MLIDTHCHIHDADYPLNANEVIERAHLAGVDKMICIGTNVVDSKLALDFANTHESVFASVGIHPHYTSDNVSDLENIINSNNRKIVAIGEIGLDYYNSPTAREAQIELFQNQIELALKYNLPIVFHVRNAFEDFWPIIDNFKGIRGVLHCFTDTMQNAQKGLDRGLYISVNGIATFTKDESQKAMFNMIPLDKLLLETDAPFLTPAPYRGKINEPAFVKNVAENYGLIRQISYDEIIRATTENAITLFGPLD